METIIVEIFVPATSSTFDFRLPGAGRVYEVINRIIYTLETTQQNQSFDKEHPVLCDLDSGRILDPSLTIAQCGLHDSARLQLA